MPLSCKHIERVGLYIKMLIRVYCPLRLPFAQNPRDVILRPNELIVVGHQFFGVCDVVPSAFVADDDNGSLAGQHHNRCIIVLDHHVLPHRVGCFFQPEGRHTAVSPLYNYSDGMARVLTDKAQQAGLRHVKAVITESQRLEDGGVEFGNAENGPNLYCRVLVVAEFQVFAFRDIDTGWLVVTVRQGSPLPNLVQVGRGPPDDGKACLK
ncbi:hypothetical protein PSPTOT1_0486 [Pseudomonas syringae pv. tomato T1]|nr:hypothetical protein PSPTOT1_0486 [Pseudomonas syringae pv. tomato T1]